MHRKGLVEYLACRGGCPKNGPRGNGRSKINESVSQDPAKCPARAGSESKLETPQGRPTLTLPRPNTPQQPYTLMFPLQISSSITWVRVHLCVHICLGVRARACAWSRQENYLTDLIGSLLRGLVTEHRSEFFCEEKNRLVESASEQSFSVAHLRLCVPFHHQAALQVWTPTSDYRDENPGSATYSGK